MIIHSPSSVTVTKVLKMLRRDVINPITFEELKALFGGEEITLTHDLVSAPEFREEFNALLVNASLKIDGWYCTKGAFINDDKVLLLLSDSSSMIGLEKPGTDKTIKITLVSYEEVVKFFEARPYLE